MLPTPPDDTAAVTPAPARPCDEPRFVAYHDLLNPRVTPLSPSAQAFLDAAARQHLPTEHLFASVDSRGRLTHVALLAPQPGRIAMLFFSAPSTPDDVQPLARLIDHTAKAPAGNAFHLIQAIIGPDDRLHAQALAAARFWPLADLEYLRATIPRSFNFPLLPTDVTFDTFCDPLLPDFLATLDASYTDTLDCPQLRGLRSSRDALQGHKATGDFDPDLWLLMRLAGNPIGVALINPVPEARCAELVYLGLDPRFRGKRLGATLLRHALAHAASRGHRHFTLAVDDRNAPALALYRSLHFHRAARKRVLLRSIHPIIDPVRP